MQTEGLQENQKSTHAEPDQFVAIVRELEDFTGRRLRGEGRVRCLRAFGESADGFERLARSARMRARRNPFGLLITMVKDGEHLLRANARVEDRQQMHEAGEMPPPVGCCLSCETGGGRHTADCPEAHVA